MWKITIRSPKIRPLDFNLKLGVNTIGRKSSNDIVIQDDSASRIHAEIKCTEDNITIRDLGSTNGTFVNHKRLTDSLELTPGDQVRIGHHLATISRIEPKRKDGNFKDEKDTAPTSTRPITSDLILESYEQNAVLIYDVANRLTTVLDLEKALQEISDFLLVAIGADRCQIIQADEFSTIKQLGFSETISGQAIEQRSSVVYPDPERPSKPSKSSEMLRINAALCVPILFEEETIALVYACKTGFNTRPFDQNDIHLAVAVSHQAALAIQRSQILANAKILEQWALTDTLTGLDNRRQVIQKGEMECNRANRFQHPLAVIMLDADELKQVNDQHGHLIGDLVLKSIASRCKNQLREVDLMGRFGGDEFLIILVETRLDEAVIVAERLLRSIADEPLITDKGPLEISVSIGISHNQNGFSDLNDLINRADEALLASKKGGKNNYEVLL